MGTQAAVLKVAKAQRIAIATIVIDAMYPQAVKAVRTNKITTNDSEPAKASAVSIRTAASTLAPQHMQPSQHTHTPVRKR